nr:hypothetical protein [Mucilaginibacter sp. L294]
MLYIPNIFGISIEVYFILLILSTPFYFVFRRLFLKKIENKTNRIISTWIATVIVTPIFYMLLVGGFILIGNHYPDRQFEQKQWLANKETRYEYSRDIIEHKILIGKTKAQVRTILGDAGNSDTDDSWYYELGFKPGSGIDPDGLTIEFKNGKVITVEQHEG